MRQEFGDMSIWPFETGNIELTNLFYDTDNCGKVCCGADVRTDTVG